MISLLPALVQAQNVVNVEEAGSLRACVEAAGLADATELTITGPQPANTTPQGRVYQQGKEAREIDLKEMARINQKFQC